MPIFTVGFVRSTPTGYADLAAGFRATSFPLLGFAYLATRLCAENPTPQLAAVFCAESLAFLNFAYLAAVFCAQSLAALRFAHLVTCFTTKRPVSVRGFTSIRVVLKHNAFVVASCSHVNVSDQAP